MEEIDESGKKVFVIDDVEYVRNICSLCRMTGREAYNSYGLKREECLSESFDLGNGVEADVRVNVPLEKGDSCWTEYILFRDGNEIACYDVEDNFFGDWGEIEGDNEGEAYSVSVYAKIGGEVLKTQSEIENALGMNAPAGPASA